MADASTDASGGLSPDEGFWVLVPSFRVAEDSSFECGDAVESPTTDGFLGDSGEPALDQVEPGIAGGRQMDMEAWMSSEPLADGRVLVSAVVVADQMDLWASVLPPLAHRHLRDPEPLRHHSHARTIDAGQDHTSTLRHLLRRRRRPNPALQNPPILNRQIKLRPHVSLDTQNTQALGAKCISVTQH